MNNVMIPEVARNGWIPNEKQRRLAKAIGHTGDIDNLMAVAAPWDATDTPAVVNWSSYRSVLSDEAEKCEKLRQSGQLLPWWKRASNAGIKIDELFVPSQGSKGSCAGFSMFQNAYLISVIKQIGRGSEQSIEAVNAMVTYALSLGCSRDGEGIPNGQSIAAVLKYAAEVGTFPAAKVGPYDAGARFEGEWLNYKPDAEKRQMSVCPISDDDGNSLGASEMATAILLALKADKVVEIGNNIAVRGNDTDSNGVSVASIGGRWAHATVFDEYAMVNGTEYFHWTNSHGNIYPNSDGSPTTGCWFKEEQVRNFFGGSLSDAGIVLYAESPHGADNLNLNPYGISGVIQ